MSTIERSPFCQMTRLQWHRLKSGGKRYERWRRIRPHPDPIGDNSRVEFVAKTRAKLGGRDLRRIFGSQA